jgi:hypothetical protein
MPNSRACLIALRRSAPDIASPITLAFDACACSRNDEKSGDRTETHRAQHLAAAGLTKALASAEANDRTHNRLVRKNQLSPPAW